MAVRTEGVEVLWSRTPPFGSGGFVYGVYLNAVNAAGLTGVVISFIYFLSDLIPLFFIIAWRRVSGHEVGLVTRFDGLPILLPDGHKRSGVAFAITRHIVQMC